MLAHADARYQCRSTCSLFIQLIIQRSPTDMQYSSKCKNALINSTLSYEQKNFRMKSAEMCTLCTRADMCL